MCGQTEIAQTTPEVTAETILEETAKWFETHKWGKGRFYNGVTHRAPDGSVDEADEACAIGAMRIVANKLCGSVYVPCETQVEEGEGCRFAVRKAVNKLAAVVGRSHIPTWNDETAQSGEEVITALRTAAGTLKVVEPAPVVEVEPAPVLAATEATTNSPRITQRRNLKPGNVFLYLAWPSSFDTGHDINQVRYVRGKEPGYLFRDTDSHKARFAKAKASYPNSTDAIMDSPCLLLAE